MQHSAIPSALAAASLLVSCAVASAADLAPNPESRYAVVRTARSVPSVIGSPYPRYRVRYVDHTHDEYCDQVRDESPDCRYIGSF